MSDPQSTLEQRLQRLEDIEAIRALTNSYHAAINDNDFANVCAVFSEDAVVVLTDGVPLAGVQAIRSGYEQAAERLLTAKQFVTGHHIELAGDAAKGLAFLDARYARKGDPTSYLLAAKLLYEYVRRQQRWYISRYEVRLYFRVPITVGWTGEKLVY